MPEATIPGVNSGNSRERRIRVFLASVPKRATRLVLAAPSDEGPMPLGEWQLAEVHEELEPLISQAIDEYAVEEESANEVKLTLSYLDEAGEVVTVLRMQARRRNVLADVARGAQSFTPTGTNMNQAQMAQMHQITTQKLANATIVTVMQLQDRMFERMERTNDRMLEVVDRLADRLAATEQRVVERDDELDEMAREVRAARAQVEAAPVGSEARQRAESLLTKLLTPEVIGTVVAKLLGAGSGPRLPPAPPEPPTEPEEPDRVD